MEVSYLLQLARKARLSNRKELEDELISLFNRQHDNGSIMHGPNDLSLSTYQYLIDEGLGPNTVLADAFYIDTSYDQASIEKQGQMIQLALKYNANFSIIPYFYKLPSIEVLTLVIERGLDCNKALRLTLNVNTYDDDEPAAMKLQLIDVLLSLGAEIRTFDQVPTNLPYTTYEYLLEKGLRPDVFLKTALNVPTALFLGGHDASLIKKKEELINLALSHEKLDFSSIYLISILPVSFVEQLLDSGLSPYIVLKIVASIGIDEHDPDIKMLKLHQQKLVNALFEKGENIDEVINQMAEFSGSFDVLELLSNNIDSLLNYTSHPLTSNNFLKAVLKSNINNCEYSNSGIKCTTNPRKVELQGNLLQKALTTGADINEVIKEIDLNIFLLYNHREFITKHLSPDALSAWAGSPCSIDQSMDFLTCMYEPDACKYKIYNTGKDSVIPTSIYD